MITNSLDPRAQSWLDRFNRLSDIFHTQIIQDIADFKADRPMTLRMARTGFLLSPYDLEPYGLNHDEFCALNNAAREFKPNQAGHDDVLNSRFENLSSLHHRATEIRNRINYLTFIRPKNTIDLVFFRCETDRNKRGVPFLKLADDASFGESISFELSETVYGQGRFKKTTKFKTDESPSEVHTIQLEPNKKYTAYFFDGYSMRGRDIYSSETPTGKPRIGSLMALRS